MNADSAPESISLSIIEAVSAAKEVSAMELTPLADVVDPDALEALFSGPGLETIEICFEYEGFLVRIDGERTVTLLDA